MEITEADERHIPAIQQIYAYHVLHGTATFETEPPGEAEMAARLKRYMQQDCPGWWRLTEELFEDTAICLYTGNGAPIALLWKTLYMLMPRIRGGALEKCCYPVQ